MKMTWIGILTALLVCPMALAEEMTLVKNGQSPFVIVVAEKPTPANERAAHELQNYVKEISGAELAIQDDAKGLGEHAILIGPSKQLDALGVSLDKGKLGNDGFVIKTVGGHLVLAGPGLRGSMYATSELLEKLGVRWFTPKVTRVPKRTTITIAAMDETQIPAFEYREPYFFEAQDKDWAARNRLIGQGFKLDASTGGTIKYADFVHTLDHLVPPGLYKEHPEYFPMVGGKRINGYVQRCLTNPDVLKLSIAAVEKTFADHPDCEMTSVSQNDAGSWCECDNCKALAKKYGGQSGAYIWFVNQVAAAMEKDLGPDKLIDTLAYQFTEQPPTGIAPRKNVRVRLCPINVCEAQPYAQDDYPATKAFMSNLAAWAKITDTMYIWHYNTNFANYLLPFPDFNEFPQDLRLYQHSGVKGIFFEGSYNSPGGAEADLRSYVMGKCLWNPAVDSDALITEWMKGVYGAAWEPMRAWLDLLQKKVTDPKQHFFVYSAPTIYYMSDDVLAEGDKLFNQAEKLAAGDKVAEEYVARERLCLRYVQITRNPQPGPAFESFIADVRKFGITNISEGGTTDAWEAQFRKDHPAKKS